MRRIDNGFYQSKTWERCRNAYYKKAGGLCERCLSVGIVKAGVIVHKGGATQVVTPRYAKLNHIYGQQSFTVPAGVTMKYIEP